MLDSFPMPDCGYTPGRSHCQQPQEREEAPRPRATRDALTVSIVDNSSESRSRG